ncbi:MAG: cell division protein SepF [Actinobacteria bacterium]|nr:cell division protein SepF [Actinomycetota bacterium]
MANALRKMANYLGLTEDSEIAVTESERVVAPNRSAEIRNKNRDVRPASLVLASSVTTIAPASSQAPMQLDLPILERIVTLHPRFYNEARMIGEHFREGNPVIINLSDMEDSERKRLVDFASGLVFGHHGTIERVTSKVFLLSPANIRVSSEDKTAAAEASFFNQS